MGATSTYHFLFDDLYVLLNILYLVPIWYWQNFFLRIVSSSLSNSTPLAVLVVVVNKICQIKKVL